MTSRGYVAMAFSFDDSMGDDLVFSCTSNDNPVSIGCTLIEIQPIALSLRARYHEFIIIVNKLYL